MAIDFTPTLKGYSDQKELPYWCQKVLPLVYDESLSYYEILGKIVAYVNNLIEDVSTLETNLETLKEIVEEDNNG